MCIYMPPAGHPFDPLKLIILQIVRAFWVYWGLLDMLKTIVSNSHFGKRPTDRKKLPLFNAILAPKV